MGLPPSIELLSKTSKRFHLCTKNSSGGEQWNSARRFALVRQDPGKGLDQNRMRDKTEEAPHSTEQRHEDDRAQGQYLCRTIMFRPL